MRDRDGHLAIAKFPNEGDDVNTVAWEAVALTLAEKAGIPVPEWRLESVTGKPVLLLRRFDRKANTRVPFLSAMSMLDARDNEARSYLEFVDALRQHGAAPREDMEALWRRIAADQSCRLQSRFVLPVAAQSSGQTLQDSSQRCAVGGPSMLTRAPANWM